MRTSRTTNQAHRHRTRRPLPKSTSRPAAWERAVAQGAAAAKEAESPPIGRWRRARRWRAGASRRPRSSYLVGLECVRPCGPFLCSGPTVSLQRRRRTFRRPYPVTQRPSTPSKRLRTYAKFQHKTERGSVRAPVITELNEAKSHRSASQRPVDPTKTPPGTSASRPCGMTPTEDALSKAPTRNGSAATGLDSLPPQHRYSKLTPLGPANAARRGGLKIPTCSELPLATTTGS